MVLAWIFTRFDVLTLLAAAFTCVFCWQNYTLLVMFRPTGSLEHWVVFAVWLLFAAAAAAIAFKSVILTGYNRVASALQ